MPDLHGWITQQIDHTEAIALDATPGPWHVTKYDWPSDFDAGIGTSLGEVDVVGHGYEGGGVEHVRDACHIAAHDPAAVLRRCEADRRILARHTIDPDVHYEPACKGCATYGDQELPYVDNLNDCRELLDLGYAHGLTPEILATLDQPVAPTAPERPEPGPGFGMPDAIHQSVVSYWLGTLQRSTPMREVPPGLRGPNWKARP
ncbi:DUF6221 family protein [Streptomyces sp. 1222.5]|uniref:DUF6221 family protein n=1 Tax=Streptomyces sp. 1222.5 TaxID=1881026 RepID=UPI003EBCB255